MLKALELVGFKSFADKTRFDFPDGITVVVGPNGSGKSNIVDAMKWVLGSQSAKSLRGKDMSDVIFKGSQTRGPAGSAEVSIIFDNPDGVLPVDAPEVRVTRRVYRSGEGEYLINNAAVRLKDVRNLIRGTGIGIDAYSLIEQGKVERMLSASAKDRRAIFEEAAGISRFKAKKVEAERRLARVQSNLTRLGDIVDEVGTRLKSLRSQASKAERYRQASDRMRSLRTSLAWTDWTELSGEIDDLDRRIVDASRDRQQAETQRDALAERRRDADAQLQQIADELTRCEAGRIETTTAIATSRGKRDADRQTHRELGEAIGHQRDQVRTIAAILRQSVDDRQAAVTAETDAERMLRETTQRAEAADAQRHAAAEEERQLRQRRDGLNRDSIALARRLADLETKQIRAAARAGEAGRMIKSLGQRVEAASKQTKSSRENLGRLQSQLDRLNDEIDEIEKQREIAGSEATQERRNLDRRREEVASLNLRRQGVVERHRVLSDLEARQEGLSMGVRDVLQRMAQRTDESSTDLGDSILGLVVDGFEVDVEIAGLIDAALGPHAQYIVAKGDDLQRKIVDGTFKIQSRVGVLRIDELPARRAGDRIRLDGLRGVIGRADRMVRSVEPFEPIIRHLLSATWLVDSIGTAIGLRKLSGAGLRFVTSGGELLENDGSIVIGPQAVSTGLISRRSELTQSAKELDHYEFQIAENTAELQRCRQRVDDKDATLGRIEDRLRSRVTDRAAMIAEVRHAEESVAQKEGSLLEIRNEYESTVRQQRETEQESETHRDQMKTIGREQDQCQSRLAELDDSMSSVGEVLAALGNQYASLAAEVSEANQRYQLAKAKREAIDGDHDQRRQQVEQAKSQLSLQQQRRRQVGSQIFATDDQLATLYLEDEAIGREIRQLQQRGEQIRRDNRDVMQASEAAVRTATEAASRLQSAESKLENVRLRRETLASRLLDDYQIDLHAEEVPEDFEAVEDRDEVEAEIGQLRTQLQKTTSVNMEALHELEELQTRYDQLHGQYQDLTAAKDSLQRMIGRINADSRRLFLDTLEAIRINFQQLYRKSFGGGQADLVLEESDDPLEAGVEILATPPGKPSFNNSLLSGGEKALTAVALLMSIFKYRPSPFCVLDEVDAPFDEANIGRFVTVLSEFLDHSKFVVVTHSKKTMTAATTLYGVTMQESGVSKQVSIRFEDVSDDGEIAAA